MTELCFPLLVVSALMCLMETRVKRLVALLSANGVFLVGTVVQSRGLSHLGPEALALILLVLAFKAVLTPAVLRWSAKRFRVGEEAEVKGIFLPVLVLMLSGASVCLMLGRGLGPVPPRATPLGMTCTGLLLIAGLLHLVYRKHWIPLLVGFSIFENGLFALSQLLRTGLPVGIELGTFLDAVMTLVAAATLQVWSHDVSDSPQLPPEPAP